MKKVLFIVIVMLVFFQNITKGSGVICQDPDSIIVIFWKGEIDRSVSRPCSQTFKNANAIKTDTTICLKSKYFDRIKNAIKSADVIKNEGYCNSKLFIKIDSMKICLCDFNKAFNANDEQVSLDVSVIYLIKWKSGFYNYIKKEYLQYFDEIKMYGIPPDYIYMYTDEKKPFRYNPIMKVCLMKEDN